MSEEPVTNDVTNLDVEPSVILDEDRIDADPLEDGMDTAEGYSRQMRLGGTAESEEPESLAYRIPQEEPDVDVEEPGRPLAATPIDDLDESVDDPENNVEVLDPDALDGEVEAERLTEGGGEVELALSSADGAAEPTGLAADDAIGEVFAVDGEDATEGAESQALHIEQER